ncbi:MAG: hypothetical protein ACQEP2_05355 [Actinomycetota bacterium]
MIKIYCPVMRHLQLEIKPGENKPVGNLRRLASATAVTKLRTKSL